MTVHERLSSEEHKESGLAYEATGMKPQEKAPVVREYAVQEERETKPAKRFNAGEMIVDILIAITPLYFIAFAILGYLRNGTPANTFEDIALMRMAKFNPTIFPILFGVIATKFIKAVREICVQFARA